MCNVNQTVSIIMFLLFVENAIDPAANAATVSAARSVPGCELFTNEVGRDIVISSGRPIYEWSKSHRLPKLMQSRKCTFNKFSEQTIPNPF